LRPVSCSGSGLLKKPEPHYFGRIENGSEHSKNSKMLAFSMVRRGEIMEDSVTKEGFLWDFE